MSRYGLTRMPNVVPHFKADFGYDYGPLWAGKKCDDTEYDLDETYHPPSIMCEMCKGGRNHSVVMLGLDDPGKDPMGKKGWGKSPLLHWAISNLIGSKLHRLLDYETAVSSGTEIAEFRHPYPKFGCQRLKISE
eukprot:528318-Amorphochlora_amoeboformis.AAC.2